eukprot:6175458-Pleurochrysis_carterae.AAC.1
MMVSVARCTRLLLMLATSSYAKESLNALQLYLLFALRTSGVCCTHAKVRLLERNLIGAVSATFWPQYLNYQCESPEGTTTRSPQRYQAYSSVSTRTCSAPPIDHESCAARIDNGAVFHERRRLGQPALPPPSARSKHDFKALLAGLL